MVRRRKTPPVAGAPRDRRGGVRNATPGTAYANRTDMAAQPIRTPPSAEYGQSRQLAAAQRAVPLAQTPAPPTPAAAPTAPTAPTGPAPGAMGDLLRPTERPDEPVTAGIAAGPGPGPEALPPMGDTTLDELRALYRMHPAESIREIIEDLEKEVGWGF